VIDILHSFTETHNMSSYKTVVAFRQNIPARSKIMIKIIYQVNTRNFLI